MYVWSDISEIRKERNARNVYLHCSTSVIAKWYLSNFSNRSSLYSVISQHWLPWYKPYSNCVPLCSHYITNPGDEVSKMKMP